MLFFVASWTSRRKGEACSEIRLDWRNAPEILCLLVATLYAFVIILKHTFSLIDSAILILSYGLYSFTALRISGGKVEETDREEVEATEEEEMDRHRQFPGGWCVYPLLGSRTVH